MYGNDERGTVCSDVSFSLVAIEDIFAAMGYRLIKVPKSPSICPIFHQPKKPELFCSEYIDEDTIYIIAGMGIVAGEKMYKKLNDGKTILWWDE